MCDRYWDSTVAYQGAARSIDAKKIEALHQIAIEGFKPDLTFVIDLEAAEGLRRIQNRKQLDRMEQESLDFHERVRQGYLALAATEPQRVKVIDGLKSIEKIHEEILQHVRQRHRS